MLAAGEILVLSGPPGSGKTTAAASLAAKLPKSVHLESDWFYRAISSGLIPPHTPAAGTQNDAIMDIATDAAIGYARAGLAVVWDGIVGPWYLDRVAERVAAAGIVLHYAVVRAPRDIALDRVTGRDQTAEVSGAEVMHHQFAALGDHERHVVSGGQPVEDIVDAVNRLLHDGRLRLVDVLQGGVANAGEVVRIGTEVRRPSNPNSPTIHRLLDHVRDAGFEGASQPIAVADGTERLVFVDGDVPIPPYPDWAQTDAVLASTAHLIRGLHDASAGFDQTGATWSRELIDRHADPAADEIVICHNDVCMENIVFRDGVAVALLDFDFAAPGRRAHDIAAFARMCVPIDDDEGAAQLGWRPTDRPRRLAVIADAYGLDSDQRSELLACLDDTIARGGEFVLRHVEAGEQAFIDMWDEMGGMARYDARRAYWSANRTLYEQAIAT